MLDIKRAGQGMIILSLLLVNGLVCGQDSQKSDAADLAKATQNPVSAMYSLPFQNNTIFGNDPFNRPQNVLNIQPVIPVSLGENLENFLK